MGAHATRLSPLAAGSSVAPGRRCLRYHDLAYNKGYRGMRDAIYLRVGDVFHAGQEAWWNGWQLPSEPRLAGALAAIQEAAQSEKNQLDAFDLVKVGEQALDAYLAGLSLPKPAAPAKKATRART